MQQVKLSARIAVQCRIILVFCLTAGCLARSNIQALSALSRRALIIQGASSAITETYSLLMDSCWREAGLRRSIFQARQAREFLGINGLGQFVGDYSASGIGHAFLFDTRTFISFDVPGGDT